MRTVTVRKDRIIGAITEVRQQHALDYAEARREHDEAKEMAMGDFRKAVEAGTDPSQAFRESFGQIVRPTSHLKELDGALERLSWHVDETIELEADEFSQYIKGDWPCLENFRAFKMQNTQYLEKGGAS